MGAIVCRWVIGLYLLMSDLEQKEGLEPNSVIVAITGKENVMHISSMNYYLFLERL